MQRVGFANHDSSKGRSAAAQDGAIIIYAGDHVGASPPNSALLQDEPAIGVLNLLANHDCREDRDSQDTISRNAAISSAPSATMSSTTDAQFAFMNPGGIRADLDAGEVTWGDLFTIQPFANDLVSMDLTGAQIDRVSLIVDAACRSCEIGTYRSQGMRAVAQLARRCNVTPVSTAP